MFTMRDFADAVADVYGARYGVEWLHAANYGFTASVTVNQRPELWADVMARAEFNAAWSEAIAWDEAYSEQLHYFDVALAGSGTLLVQALDLMHAWRVARMAAGESVVDVRCRPGCYPCRLTYPNVREAVTAALDWSAR